MKVWAGECKQQESRYPFPLPLQGPPGTGKTHTVLGILNSWHLVQVKGREGRWLIMRWRGGIKITLECLSREVMGFSLNHKPLP